MNRAEAMQLLTIVAGIDGRRIDEAAVLAWHGAVGDLSYADAAEAVRRHFAKSTEWLMPAHVRAGVLALRDERRPRAEVLSLPSRFEDDPERDARMRVGLAKVVAALDMARVNRPRAIEADEKPPPSASDLIRERAIRRAVAERGGSRAIEAPRRRDHRGRGVTDFATPSVDLGEVRECATCHGRYTIDDDGIKAHRAVFGHTPSTEGEDDP